MKKNEFINRIFTVFPYIIPALLGIAANLTAYFIPQLINLFRELTVFATRLDTELPFVPVFAVSYVGAFIQWVIYYLRLAHGGSAPAYRFLSAECLGKLICMIFFIVFPITMVRPGIEVNGVFTWVCSVIYAFDRPVCLFPSIHCMQSWLCMRYIITTREPSLYKVFCVLFSISVLMSTVLIKQHLVCDVIAGVITAEACLFIADHTSLPEKFGSFSERLREKVLNND